MDIQVEMQTLYSDVFQAAAVSRQQGDEIAGTVGQTQARWQTLWTIGSGSFTVPQVARRLGVSRQNVQRLSDELAREGLVEHLDNPDHKTSPLLSLTKPGQKTLAAMNDASDAIHLQMLDHINPNEVATLRRLLRTFTQAVQATSSPT